MNDTLLFDSLCEEALSVAGLGSFNLTSSAFPKQLEFITHPNKLKALFCTRRAAKSYTGGLYLVDEALKNPGVNCLYIGLTRLSAKNIVWKDVLKDINTKNNLGMKFNGTELNAVLPNGSIISVTGADAGDDEIDKLLGRKYRLVIIDEAASFTIDLRRLIYGVLKPATVDEGGTICLLGTSGDLTTGLFFDITTGKEPGWSLFKWTAFDNPYIAKQWQEELDDIHANRPLFMDTPLFKQWYLNEWVVDSDKLVYRYLSGRNDFTSLPRVAGTPQTKWNYVLGVDLGYSPDPSAFVLCAFNDYDPNLYLVSCFKEKQMDITDVANKIRYYQSQYSIEKIIIDGANAQAVAEIQKRHSIGLTAAEKTGKADFISIMNAEFIQGKIKLSPECGELKEEYSKLIWSDKNPFKKEENPNCANHLTDAALYSWRYCYTYMSEAYKAPVNVKNHAEWSKHSERLMEEALQKQIDKEQEEEKFRDFYAISQMGMDEDPMNYYVQKRKR